MKIIKKILEYNKRVLEYNKRAKENSNKVINTINWLSFFILIGSFIFFRDTFFYNWFGFIALIGLITHPYIQLKIKKIIKETISTNKILKSKELDWLELK